MRKKKGKRLRGSTEDQEGKSRANYKKKTLGLNFYYYFLAFFKKIGKESLSFFFIFDILLDFNFSSYFYFYNFYLIYLK